MIFETVDHCCVPIGSTDMIPAVGVCTMQENGNEHLTKEKVFEKKKRKQSAHTPKKRRIALLKDVNVWKEKYPEILSDVEQNGAICMLCAKTLPKPIFFLFLLPIAVQYKRELF